MEDCTGKPVDGCAKGHGAMGRWKTTQESPWIGVQKVTGLSGDKTTQGGPSQLTTLFRFRPWEFGSRPMAQSRQSTSGITVVVGFLPGTTVTTWSSKPDGVFFTSLTYWKKKKALSMYGRNRVKVAWKQRFFSQHRDWTSGSTHARQARTTELHPTFLLLILEWDLINCPILP